MKDKIVLKLTVDDPDRWTNARAWIDGKEFHPGPSLKVRNHSPSGFSWGYAGSGPAQLALAICIRIYQPLVAMKVYQDFKFKFIAGLPQESVTIEIDLKEFNETTVFNALADLGEEKRWVENEGLNWNEYLKGRKY